MVWLKENVVRVLLTVIVATVSALAGVRAELKRDIEKKADCGAVNRELDQLHAKLDHISAQLDAVALQLVTRSK